MLKLTTSEIRKKWIDFFVSKQHLFLEPVSLIPNNDPSLLWINSGVATLKDYFSGKTNPPNNRLVNSQKAIRTNDIFNVGLTSRHHTLFEMLGNFSIGDYFKKEAIKYAYEFLVDVLKVDVNKLWFTVFEEDDKTYELWQSHGVKKERILKCSRDRNFWDVGNGPCGPCTEIHYDRGEKYDFDLIGEKLIKEDIENDRFVEIWNIVFSQYNNDGNNNYSELKRKNIDTGAGLERIASISQDVPTNFDTDVFQAIIRAVEKHSKYQYDINEYFNKNQKQYEFNFCYKVIADHIRASVFAIADGAIPSNKERGYILRRLIRRVLIFVRKLEIQNNDWLVDAVDATAKSMGDFYSYLNVDTINKVKKIILKEVELFNKTLQQGLKIFNSSIVNNKLDKDVTFKLVDTYGFPIELIKEISRQQNVEIDLQAFEEMFKHHQQISNASKKAKAMEQQNDSLMKLDVESKFLYDIYELKNAKVIKVFDEDFNDVCELNDESGYVVFDQTCFYATSGGQINDTGHIVSDKKQYVVVDVIKAPNFQHVHYFENISIKLNDLVDLFINKKDRLSVSANHSAEHLLHYSLKQVINKDIKQEGAAKYPYKVTFDFTHHEQLQKQQLNQLEDYLNDLVKQDLKTQQKDMDLEEAKAIGAMSYFGEVYKKIKGKLRVIFIGPSIELCGGTHVKSTSEIQKIKIVDCSSKGSGSWRITMITRDENIVEYLKEKHSKNVFELNKIVNSFIVEDSKINKQLHQYLNYNNFSVNDFDFVDEHFELLKEQLIQAKIEFEKNNAKNEVVMIKKTFSDESTVVVKKFDNLNNKNIFNALNELINEQQSKVFISFNIDGDKIQYLIATNERFAKQNQLNLNNWIKQLNELCNGKGGGKPFFVQGGCADANHIEELIKKAMEFSL